MASSTTSAQRRPSMRPVERLGDQRAGPSAGAEAEHELAGVEDLDRQPPADLHLAVVERRCRCPAGPLARPVAHRVGAVLLEQVDRGDDVALGLRHLLAVRVEDPAGDRGVASTAACRARSARGRRGEQPGADDLVAPAGAGPSGRSRREQVGVALPAADDLRGQRRRRPGVHDVGVADEAAGLAALVLGVAGGRVGRRVDRQVGPRSAAIGVVVVGLAVGVERVPDRERHAEEPLPADQPVAVEALDPVLVAAPACTAGASCSSSPALERASARSVVVAAAVADVPLPGGDDLQRPVALLVELHRVRDRPRLAVQVAATRAAARRCARARRARVLPASSAYAAAAGSAASHGGVSAQRAGRRGR